MTSAEMQLLCANLEVTDQTRHDGFYLYPNPAGERFIIVSNTQESTQAAVHDATGKKIYEGGFADGIPTTNWSPGVYFVRITDNPSAPVRKLIVR